MPNPRKEILATGETYHIYNHSIADEEIFSNQILLKHVLELFDFYRFPQSIRFSKYRQLNKDAQKCYLDRTQKNNPLVEIYAYAIMPNHFHLLLKQILDDGIKLFLSNFQNGFAKYYNTKHKRQGSVFTHPFKSKRVTSQEQFIHISRYVHLNPVTSFVINFDQLKTSILTSFPRYLGIQNNAFINTRSILDLFKSVDKYEDFVANQVSYQQKLGKIKNLLFD